MMDFVLLFSGLCGFAHALLISLGNWGLDKKSAIIVHCIVLCVGVLTILYLHFTTSEETIATETATLSS